MTQLDKGPPATETQPPVAKVRRSRDDRMLAGVCGGLGNYLGVDPLWFRLAFVLLTIGAGSGVLLYIIAWVIIPEQGKDSAEARSSTLAKDGPVIAGVVLIGVGLLFLFNTLVPWFDQVIWPLLVVVAGVGLFYGGSRRDNA